jgi:hypothetical protein
MPQELSNLGGNGEPPLSGVVALATDNSLRSSSELRVLALEVNTSNPFNGREIAACRYT